MKSSSLNYIQGDYMSETIRLAIETSLISITVVFIILGLLTLILIAFKYIPNSETKEQEVPFEDMDEDMQVAVLVATIDARRNNTNMRLKSVRRIS